MNKILRLPQTFWKLKGCPRIFSALFDLKFWQKTWYPLLYIKFAETSIFLKHGRDAHEFIRLCKTKVFRRKIMILPFFICKNFLKRELLSKIVGFVHKNFRQGETKIFRQENVIPPFMNKVFRYPKFSETLKGCPGNFSVLWDRIFSTKICDTRIMHKVFPYPKIFETLKGCPRNISALWDRKILTEIRHTLYYA